MIKLFQQARKSYPNWNHVSLTGWGGSGHVKDLSHHRLYRLMTVTQFVTGLCLNEVERRGELTYSTGQDGTPLAPIVPYCSDYGVDTVLTRPERRH